MFLTPQVVKWGAEEEKMGGWNGMGSAWDSWEERGECKGAEVNEKQFTIFPFQRWNKRDREDENKY